MNYYDQKILDFYTNVDGIYELIRTKKGTLKVTSLDKVADHFFRFTDEVKGKGNYYLIRKGKVLLLVFIKPKTLTMQTYDVTKEVKETKDGKKFSFQGICYRVHRKLK